MWRTHLAPLDGLRVLKTDLWDEAKNTRILRWAAEAGIRAFGVDISPGIVRRAGSWVRLLKQRRHETGEVAPRV